MKKHPNLLLFGVALLFGLAAVLISRSGTGVVSAFGDKRMTIEDALAIRQIGAPQFSPDGNRIAYTI
ncbi:MAG: hypothetical protein J2P52_17615, partial [Blastocatellia bacterium]|nr:hypothetical protein [Blastocatellia bacterium]